jgi:squalene-associated FAD-dependent desaturase
MMQNKKVIIIGAGIAGISAAVELATKNIKPILLESRKFPGGRAYSHLDSKTNDVIDNGQHLLMGAYTNYLNLLKKLNTYDKLSFSEGIKIPFYRQNQRLANFDTTLFPGKVGMLLGLFGFNLLSITEKLLAIKFILSLFIRRQSFQNMTVKNLLIYFKQNDNSISNFWEPLCLATMNATIDNCSAEIFKTIIQKAFFSKSEFSRIIFPKAGLSELLGNWESYIIDLGGEIHYNTRVDEFILENSKLIGVKSLDKDFYGDYIVSAIPPNKLKTVVDKSNLFGNFEYLEKFSFSPIISVYLWFDKEILESKINACLGTHIQWIFNKRLIAENNFNDNNSGHYALTISGADSLIDKSKDEIINICIKEINSLFPTSKSSKLLHSVVIKEKYATIKITPEIQKIRPVSETDIPNLFLAGDWTNTGLPATLESAAFSGKIAAESVLKSIA